MQLGKIELKLCVSSKSGICTYIKEKQLLHNPAVKRKLLTYRDGAKKFLKRMYELDIPVIIVSAGIGNIIVEFLKEEDDLYPNIHIISICRTVFA